MTCKLLTNIMLRLFMLYIVNGLTCAFNPFADKTLFDVTWPGGLQSIEENTFSEYNSVLIRTLDNEQYRCIFPLSLEADEKSNIAEYTGPSEEELLKPLFQPAEKVACSYRLETYWSYELCHGRHLRQYHEERESTKQRVHVQEYFLGYFKKPTEEPQQTSADKSQSPPVLKIDGYSMPYYRVDYTDGTPCDLTGEPRRAVVKYGCHPNSHGEIYQMRETSSCEYEVIVLSGHLCAHPHYSPSRDTVNTIRCHSLDGAPSRPLRLDSFEPEHVQNMLIKEMCLAIAYIGGTCVMLSRQMPGGHTESDGDSDGDGDDDEANAEQKVTYSDKRHSSPVGTATDKQLLKDFLSGDHCVHGGTGWWKHELCFGKKVIQYHEEGSTRNTIVLGVWKEDKHLHWLQKNPDKQPKNLQDKKQIVHYYGDGSFCELTKKNRHVEVKLKCVENSKHPHAIAIYLQETSTCEYTLVVESSMLCSAVEHADANGLIVDYDM